MLVLETTGNSHGYDVVGMLSGLPAGIPVDPDGIRQALALRRTWQGRGKRQGFEQDEVAFIQGVNAGLTTGEPLILRVKNMDYRESLAPLTVPVPGHGDIGAAVRIGQADFALVRERTSARDTVVRVALGEVVRSMLGLLGVDVAAHVSSFGRVRSPKHPYSPKWIRAMRGTTGMLSMQDRAMDELEWARKRNLSLGGVIRVVADGMPPGLGGFETWALKLDARLAQALMAIPSVKAVAVGAKDLSGPWRPDLYGKVLNGGVVTGLCGGIEAGMTTGAPMELFVTLKPISGVKQPIPSLDLTDGTRAEAPYIRSDVTALGPAVQVVEAQVAAVLADAVLGLVNGPDMGTLQGAWEAYKNRAKDLLGPMGPVVLCGMPGVGKTTVGQGLAHVLDMDFLDTDQMVEKAMGMDIARIFKRVGESQFRAMEAKAAAQAMGRGKVVSLGGGTLSDELISRIGEVGGVLVFLDADLDLLTDRVMKKQGKMPLFRGMDMAGVKQRMTQLWLKRKPLFEQADFRVESGDEGPDFLVNEIVSRLGVWRISRST